MSQPQQSGQHPSDDLSTELTKSLSWLHCNECHRGFEHHNRLHVTSTSTDSHSIRIIKSDLRFGFTSCGHFFCDNCFKLHSIYNQNVIPCLGASGSFVCPFCKEQAAQYHLDNFVPKKLEMYMRPPTGLLEDALSVMLVILGFLFLIVSID